MPQITFHFWFEESVWTADAWDSSGWILESSRGCCHPVHALEFTSAPSMLLFQWSCSYLPIFLSQFLPSPLYSLHSEYLCLWDVMWEGWKTKMPCIKINQILLATWLLHFILTLCSFKPLSVLERSSSELPLPFPGMRRTLCKCILYF